MLPGEIPVLIALLLHGHTFAQDTRSMRMTKMIGWQFQCDNTTCTPFLTTTVSNIRYCQTTCLSRTACRALSFRMATSTCALFRVVPDPTGNMLSASDTVTMIVTDGTRMPSVNPCLTVNCNVSGGGGYCNVLTNATADYRCTGCTYGADVTDGSCPSNPCASIICGVSDGNGTCQALGNGTSNYSCLACTFGSDTSDSSCPARTNLVINGNAEVGACATNTDTRPPTKWSYTGSVTQAEYTIYQSNQNFTVPGPSDRGRCFFYGQSSVSSSMWQNGSLTQSFSSLLIDSHSVRFNFSSWLGGFEAQDDNAKAALTFFNQSNQTLGASTILGPVFSADHGSVSALIFLSATGYVPVSARYFSVKITITRVDGAFADAWIDNIALYLYR